MNPPRIDDQYLERFSGTNIMQALSKRLSHEEILRYLEAARKKTSSEYSEMRSPGQMRYCGGVIDGLDIAASLTRAKR